MTRQLVLVLSILIGLASGAVRADLGLKDVCGLAGTDEMRIEDCARKTFGEPSFHFLSEKPTWFMITRTISKSGELLVFWKDTGKGGRIWSEPLEEKMSQEDARNACDSYYENYVSLDFPNRAWELPSADDYGLALEHGIGGLFADDYNSMLKLNMGRRYPPLPQAEAPDWMNLKDEKGNYRLFWTSTPSTPFERFSLEPKVFLSGDVKIISSSYTKAKNSVQCVAR